MKLKFEFILTQSRQQINPVINQFISAGQLTFGCNASQNHILKMESISNMFGTMGSTSNTSASIELVLFISLPKKYLFNIFISAAIGIV